MIPFCRTVAEARRVIDVMKRKTALAIARAETRIERAASPRIDARAAITH